MPTSARPALTAPSPTTSLQDCQYAVPEDHEDGLVLLAAAASLVPPSPGSSQRGSTGENWDERRKSSDEVAWRAKGTWIRQPHGWTSMDIPLS